MTELPLKKDIEKHSYDILKSSKSFDVFPTPVDKIVQYTELIVRNDIDISEIHTGYFTKKLDVLKRAVSKVRGMLDRSERTIYLDLSQKKERKNFVKLHEAGHEILPWQKGLHDLLDDDDNTLSADTHEEFEAEANYFASVTLFQHDRFIDEVSKLKLSIESSIHLSKYFGASIHATLRRYVEYSTKRCALIVLENFSPKSISHKCAIRNTFMSEKFHRTFGSFLLETELDNAYAFVKDFYNGRRLKTDGLINLLTENGESDFNYHFFTNTYNAFVFIFPIGEKNKTRTNFIIQNVSDL